MKFSRATALSLLSGLGAASPDAECSPVTTTIYQPTTVTLGGEGGYGGASTVYSTVTVGSGSASTVTVQAPASTVTVSQAPGTTGPSETPIETFFSPTVGKGASVTTSSSLKSFGTSTPIISGTESLLGITTTKVPAASGSGAVTAVNVISGVSTVQVCPTGASTYDCTEVVYGSGGQVIVVNIITINVTVDVYGQPTTVTITKIESATSTPSIPASGTGSVIGTKVGAPSGSSVKSSGKPTGPYYSGNGTHVGPTGTTGTNSPTKPTGTEKPSKPTHVIAVGQNGTLGFSPGYVNAEEGETVRFEFYPKNHTVTSCDVESPCVKNGVFDSGFKPVLAKNMSTFIDFPVTNASNPLFFFSRQTGECEAGMVFAINPKSVNQYDNFTSAAKGTKTTTSSRLLVGTGVSSGTSRPTGAPFSRNGTYSFPHSSGTGRPSSTGSISGVSVTRSIKSSFPTGSISKIIGSGTGTVHPSGTGGGVHSNTFSLSTTKVASPSSIISSRSSSSVVSSKPASVSSPISSSSKASAFSSAASSTRSSATKISLSSLTSSIASLTTSSINGYVPYSFPTPVASYVAQPYQA